MTSEERAELRALCELFARYEASDGRMWREEVEDGYEAAAAALPRLLDALERKDAALLRYGNALERLANPVDGVDTIRSMADDARRALNPAWPKSRGKGMTAKEFLRKLRALDRDAAPPEQGRPSGEAA